MFLDRQEACQTILLQLQCCIQRFEKVIQLTIALIRLRFCWLPSIDNTSKKEISSSLLAILSALHNSFHWCAKLESRSLIVDKSCPPEISFWISETNLSTGYALYFSPLSVRVARLLCIVRFVKRTGLIVWLPGELASFHPTSLRALLLYFSAVVSGSAIAWACHSRSSAV